MSTELSSQEFREKIRRSFRGQYWDPKKFILPGEGGASGQTPENPFPEGSRVDEKEIDTVKIGTCEQKQFEGKAAFKLKLMLPFLKHEDFLIVPNSKKESESHPDFVALQGSQRLGALWKKTTEKGDILSGYINSPIFPNWKFSFAIIKKYAESGALEGYEPIASEPKVREPSQDPAEQEVYTALQEIF